MKTIVKTKNSIYELNDTGLYRTMVSREDALVTDEGLLATKENVKTFTGGVGTRFWISYVDNNGNERNLSTSRVLEIQEEC
jgi:hypothetical protein